MSLPIDHRQVFTISPDSNGVIDFSLLPSAYGALALSAGTITGSYFPKYVGSTDLSVTWATGTITVTPGSTRLIAHDVLMTSAPQLGGTSLGPYSVIGYRPIMQVAEISFTGAAMTNGGVVKTWKFTPYVNHEAEYTFNTKEVTKMVVEQGPSNSTAAGLDVHPARTSFQVRNVAPKPEYEPIWVESNSPGTGIYPYAQTSTGTPTTEMIWPGLSTQMRSQRVIYSGLDSSSTITVEIRTCIQYSLKSGAMPGLASPSPPASLSLWQQAANFANSLPTSQILGYARGAIQAYSAYNRRGVGALLALTNQHH